MRTLPHKLSIFQNYLFLVLWLVPYVYFFNLSNQITGIDEDFINKPDRPIPSGKVTIAGAKLRWTLVFAVFLSIAVYEPALWAETVCWVLAVTLLCATPFGNHWFVKNCVAMSTGTWALLGVSWKAIAPLTPRSKGFILFLSLWVGLMTHIQDLRDMKGDAAVGRQTLPLVFGSARSRWIITYLIMPVSLWVLWVGGILSLAPVSLLAAHAFLGYRIIHDKGSFYDHKTYMVHFTLSVPSTC
ncbi:hypothetical protein K435DRAFT_695715 [Dendrothele bispora CBS 962.96]|uniref:UbiA prenyltransferase n=1 Tax=Dendrothele bispora (strain CBS 962.96) TaxID=1314807 RepID=A0A4S8KXW7_DENBC|nr:hypothetical protein K435DRAFT_695715 [Dendrothele bispora CBS 962.96]